MKLPNLIGPYPEPRHAIMLALDGYSTAGTRTNGNPWVPKSRRPSDRLMEGHRQLIMNGWHAMCLRSGSYTATKYFRN